MEVLIRPARVSDQETFYRLLCDLENETLGRDGFEKAFLKNIKNDDIGYFIAERGGDPIGLASCHVQMLLHHAAPIAEIQEIYVVPNCRSLGVGKRLMAVMREFARQHGALQLEVTTRQTRTDAHRFYEREGFVNSHFKLVLVEGQGTRKDASKRSILSKLP